MSAFPKGLPKEFKPVFSYRIINGKPTDNTTLDCTLWELPNIVYARACDGVIIYVGKSDSRLRDRIQRHLSYIPKYKKEKDIKFRKFAEGKVVTIYAYQPEPIKLCGLDVHVHAGLESALIDMLNPPYVSKK